MEMNVGSINPCSSPYFYLYFFFSKAIIINASENDKAKISSAINHKSVNIKNSRNNRSRNITNPSWCSGKGTILPLPTRFNHLNIAHLLFKRDYTMLFIISKLPVKAKNLQLPCYLFHSIYNKIIIIRQRIVGRLERNLSQGIVSGLLSVLRIALDLNRQLV